jgi:hypothetical protein
VRPYLECFGSETVCVIPKSVAVRLSGCASTLRQMKQSNEDDSGCTRVPCVLIQLETLVVTKILGETFHSVGLLRRMVDFAVRRQLPFRPVS